MIKYRKFGTLILSLITLLLFAAVNVTALSEDNNSVGDVPDLPLILQGGMDVNGEPVTAGSEILAYYEGELIAKSMVGEEGRYSLYLNLTPGNYTDIEKVEYYVDGDKVSYEIPASQLEMIKNAASGSVIEVDLNSPASSSDSDADSGGSSSSQGEARIVKKDTSGSEAPDKTEDRSEASFTGEGDIADAESPVSQVNDEGGEDIEDVEGAESAEGAEGAEGTEDAGYSTIFTVLIFVAALFGAFMIVKK